MDTIINFLSDKWQLLLGISGGTGVTGFIIRDLWYKFRYGSYKKVVKTATTFKNDTIQLVAELKSASAEMKVAMQMIYELAKNANIAREAKEVMRDLIRGVIPETEDVEEEETPEDPRVLLAVSNNNQSITELLKGL